MRLYVSGVLLGFLTGGVSLFLYADLSDPPACYDAEVGEACVVELVRPWPQHPTIPDAPAPARLEDDEVPA